MSFSNIIRIPLDLSHVDVFTFGESLLFGYNSSKNSLLICSLSQLNDISNESIKYLSISIPIKSSVRRLILNCDETILALIAEETAYLVYLPPSKILSSKGFCSCSVNVIPSQENNLTSMNNILIDFVWLCSNYFVIVNSNPSQSECHLYKIQQSKLEQIQYIQTFSVGLSLEKNLKRCGTPNKRISTKQSSDILKLDVIIRKKQNFKLILLFAMKTDGDLFIMEIDKNHLLNSENGIKSEFQGPIRILPSTHDNYGFDYSNIICLSCSPFPIVSFIRNKTKINQCILIKPNDEYYLYTIDLINLTINENNQTIKSMIIDKLNSNIYYVFDSLSNIYSIEILWINFIKEKFKKLPSTNIKYLIKSNNLIESIGIIQTNYKEKWLTFINKQINQQQKELVLIRLSSLYFNSFKQNSNELKSSNFIIKKRKQMQSNEHVNNIIKIPMYNKLIPEKIFPSLLAKTNSISNSDFEKILFQNLKISQKYFEKQEKIHLELENKQCYLYDIHQVQLMAYKELFDKFQLINETFQILKEKHEKENIRRQCLSIKVHDLLLKIEENSTIQSDSENFTNEQLKRYEIKIKSLQEKSSLLKESIRENEFINQNEQTLDQLFMKKIHRLVEYYKNELDSMKEKLKTIHYK